MPAGELAGQDALGLVAGVHAKLIKQVLVQSGFVGQKDAYAGLDALSAQQAWRSLAVPAKFWAHLLACTILDSPPALSVKDCTITVVRGIAILRAVLA